MRSAAMFLALITVASGCGDGASYVVVTLDSGRPLAVTRLDVDVSNAGSMTHVSTHLPSALAIPPSKTFSFQFGAERRGDATFDVHAFGDAGEVGHGVGTVTLVPGAGQTHHPATGLAASTCSRKSVLHAAINLRVFAPSFLPLTERSRFTAR